MRSWLIKLLGGIPVYNRDSRQKVLNEAVSSVYKAISFNDILQEKEGKFFYQNKPLSPQRSKQIYTEAVNFNSSKLWEVLQKDIEYQAGKKTIRSSANFEDVIGGKIAFYMLDIIRTRLRSLSKGSGNFNK